MHEVGGDEVVSRDKRLKPLRQLVDRVECRVVRLHRRAVGRPRAPEDAAHAHDIEHGKRENRDRRRPFEEFLNPLHCLLPLFRNQKDFLSGRHIKLSVEPSPDEPTFGHCESA